MTLLFVFLAIPSGLIVLVHLLMYVGLTIARKRETQAVSPHTETSNLPAFLATVVVPARDEEPLLPRLLESLDRQTTSNFSIVLVNDRSKDRTGALMDAFSESHPGRVRVIHVTDAPEIGNSKLNALILGTANIETECIFFTDADCIVPPEWVADMLQSFADDRVGLVLGPIETRRTKTLLSRFHAYDHIFKGSYNAACTGIGQATGGFGNNLGVRTRALVEVGGMSALSVSVTEDAALVTALREHTDWHIRARFDRTVTVQTEPQPGFKELTRQEVRWHTGGLFSNDAFSRLSYRFLMFFLTGSVLLIPLIPVNPLLAIPPVVSFTTMSGMAFLAGIYTRQSMCHHWIPFVPFMCFSMLYNSLLTILAMLRPRIVWKGEILSGYRGSKRRRTSL